MESRRDFFLQHENYIFNDIPISYLSSLWCYVVRWLSVCFSSRLCSLSPVFTSVLGFAHWLWTVKLCWFHQKPLIFKALATWSVSLEWPSLNTTQAHVKHLSGLGNHDYLLRVSSLLCTQISNMTLYNLTGYSSPKTDHSVIIYKCFFHFWLEYSYKWPMIISFSGKCPSVNSYSNYFSCMTAVDEEWPDAFGIPHFNSQFWKIIFGWTMILN